MIWHICAESDDDDDEHDDVLTTELVRTPWLGGDYLPSWDLLPCA